MQITELIAGTTLNFLTEGGDYPATDGWTLVYYLRLRSGAGAIDLTATPEGADYRIQVPASGAGSTALWTPGVYSWESRVTKGTEKYTLERGQITVHADITAAGGTFDSRSQAQKAYDDARAAYAAFSASNGTKRSYRIGEREVTFASVADIVQVINYWAVELRREQRREALAKGLADPSKTYVRFDRA